MKLQSISTLSLGKYESKDNTKESRNLVAGVRVKIDSVNTTFDKLLVSFILRARHCTLDSNTVPSVVVSPLTQGVSPFFQPVLHVLRKYIYLPNNNNPFGMTWGHSYSVPGLSLSWKYGLSAAGPDILMYNYYSLTNRNTLDGCGARAPAALDGNWLRSKPSRDKKLQNDGSRNHSKSITIHGQFSREGYQQVQCC